MSIEIRPFRTDDYPAIVEVGNAAYPDYPGTVEEMRYYDEHREPTHKFARFVAERAGRIVGAASYMHTPWMFHPRKFFFDLSVRPEEQGQGVGSALYNYLIGELEKLDALVVRIGSVREDMTRGVRFLQDRGFHEEMRGWESRLDVAAFDPTPYAAAEEAVRDQGIEIRTLRELEGDPDRDQRLYVLSMELEADVPQPEPFTTVSFELWSEHALQSPNLLPDAFLVAIDRGEYVAISHMWSSKASPDLQTGLTAVKRDYRRRGIARALKLRGIAYAKSQGVATIRTWNESNNRPMLAINERLGYQKQPAWITFAKVLKDEE
jgi:GNAT superfamily N-acetyltransferase